MGVFLPHSKSPMVFPLPRGSDVAKFFTFKAEVTIKVAEYWVADGFEIKRGGDRLREIIQDNILTLANDSEKRVKVKMTALPSRKAIRKAQGY